MSGEIKITVEAAEALSWPQMCICCGEPARGGTFIVDGESYQRHTRHGLSSTPRRWILPCCPHCSSHWKEAKDRYGIAIALYVLGALVGVFAIPAQDKVLWIIAGSLAGLGALFHIVMALKPYKTTLKPNCAARVPADYMGRTKDKFETQFPRAAYLFVFRNKSFADAFFTANQEKCKLRINGKLLNTTL